MTQGQLAEAIGCRVKDISRWENGHVEPGVLTVKKIAQVLGCSMDELVRRRTKRSWDCKRTPRLPFSGCRGANLFLLCSQRQICQ